MPKGPRLFIFAHAGFEGAFVRSDEEGRTKQI